MLRLNAMCIDFATIGITDELYERGNADAPKHEFHN